MRYFIKRNKNVHASNITQNYVHIYITISQNRNDHVFYMKLPSQVGIYYKIIINPLETLNIL